MIPLTQLAYKKSSTRIEITKKLKPTNSMINLKPKLTLGLNFNQETLRIMRKVGQDQRKILPNFKHNPMRQNHINQWSQVLYLLISSMASKNQILIFIS